ETRKDAGVLGEIPSAYKGLHAVMRYQSDLVEPVAHLQTVLCVKGGCPPHVGRADSSKTGLEPAPWPDPPGLDPTGIDELLPQPHGLGRCDQAAPARKAEQLPRADALDRRSPAHRCPVIGHEHCTEPALLDDRERLGLTKMLLGVVPRGRHLPAKMSDRG